MNSWYGVLGSGASEKHLDDHLEWLMEILALIYRHANDTTIGTSISSNGITLLFSNEGVYPDPTIVIPAIDKPASHGVGGSEVVRPGFETIYQDTDSCKTAIVNHDDS